MARSARHVKGHSSPPRYAPLRALARGYDCIALRAMPLRDGIPLPYSGNFCRIMQSLIKSIMVNTLIQRLDAVLPLFQRQPYCLLEDANMLPIDFQ